MNRWLPNPSVYAIGATSKKRLVPLFPALDMPDHIFRCEPPFGMIVTHEHHEEGKRVRTSSVCSSDKCVEEREAWVFRETCKTPCAKSL